MADRPPQPPPLSMEGAGGAMAIPLSSSQGSAGDYGQLRALDDNDDDNDGPRLLRRHSSLSLREEEVLGVSPPPPIDCEGCLHLHRQHSASQLQQQHHHHHHHHHHGDHHHHHHGHNHHQYHHQQSSSPLPSPPPSSPPSFLTGAAASPPSGGSATSREGLPPRLPVLAPQRQSSVLPRAPPDLMSGGSQTSSFVFSPSYHPPAPPVPSPGMGAYAIPQSPPPGIITKPRRIILVRHGESTGNVDEKVYVTTPDWKVPLSPRGHEQARELGRKLKEIIGNEPLYVYTSPYLRTKQTLAGMLESFEENLKVGIREEPRITEQQFGNFQNHEEMQQCKRQRSQFGRFYYRFPDGESGLDVYTRVTSFISTMFRDFADGHICRPDLNVVIVTHGLTLRLLLMRWFKLTVDTFETTTNPPNGSFVVMSRKEGPQMRPGGRSGGGVYELAPESAALISLSYNAVPVGPSLKTPTSTSTANSSDGEDGGAGRGKDGGEGANGGAAAAAAVAPPQSDGGDDDVAAALTARLKTLEMQPSSLSLSDGEQGGRG